jgi:hypothetical protein
MQHARGRGYRLGGCVVLLAGTILGLAGCGAANVDEDALSTTERHLLEQLVEQNMEVISRMKNSGSQELAIVFNLLGRDGSSGSFPHEAAPCQTATAFKETCQSDFPGNASPLGPGIDGCFRDGCLDANLRFVDIYITSSPHRLPDDRGPLSYALDASWPKGTVAYQPNPLTRWVVDSHGADVVTMADLGNTVQVTLDAQAPLDMSYSGHVSTTLSTSGFAVAMMIKVPMLTSRGAIEIAVSSGPAESPSGQITIGSTTLASVSNGEVIWK